MDEIFGYLSTKLYVDIAAEDLMDKIESTVMRLKEWPFSGSYVLDELLKGRGYRKLIVDNYIVFYLVNEEEKQVVVMRILYGPSRYQNFL